MEKKTLEVNVPGGKLVAFAYDEQGVYPGIGIYFVPDGEYVEYDVCFVEHDAAQMEAGELQLGMFYSNSDEVKEIFHYDFRDAIKGESDA